MHNISYYTTNNSKHTKRFLCYSVVMTAIGASTQLI
jgi:hypothetical protein